MKPPLSIPLILSASAIIALLVVPAVPVQAMEPAVRVRLIRASPETGATDPALVPLADLLRQNMTFRSFRLMDSQTVPLPAARTLQFPGGLRLTLNGPVESLDVTLLRGRHTILKTRAVLHRQAPLFIGGVPDGAGGTLLFSLDLVEGNPP